MRRKLFTLAAAASALLCLGVCGLWVRSYWVADSWDRDVPGARVGVGSFRGRVWWDRIDFGGTGAWASPPPGYHAVPVSDGAVTVNTPPAVWSFAGFRWTNYRFAPWRVAGGLLIQDLAVPDWSLALATGLLPSLWLVGRLRRRRRPAPGYCPQCGYDLRATPERCPECGAARVPG